MYENCLVFANIHLLILKFANEAKITNFLLYVCFHSTAADFPEYAIIFQLIEYTSEGDAFDLNRLWRQNKLFSACLCKYIPRLVCIIRVAIANKYIHSLNMHSLIRKISIDCGGQVQNLYYVKPKV